MPAQIYKKELVDSPYDTLVIGSGIGGLATAALLAKQGQKVLILERHYVAGGFTHTFSRKGYEWDVGVHYIGEVHRKNSVLRRLFDFISDGNLKWAYMPEVYDKVFLGERAYDYVAGVEPFKNYLYSQFPLEKGAIDGYFKAVFSVAKAARNFFGERALPPMMGRLAAPFMCREFFSFSDKTTFEVLSSLTQNPELIGLLSAQYGDYGLPPKKSSFAIHAMVAKHYFDGGNYPIGGSSQIAETIIPIIEKSGGKVLIRADVSEIKIEKGKVVGVLLKNGDEISATRVVSDAGVMNTYGKMLKSEVRSRYGLDSKLKTVTPSLAHVGLYLGFKKTDEEMGFNKANYWIYPGPDHDKSISDYIHNPDAPLPVTYISFPSAKDPTWVERHKGRSTMEVVGFTPYAWFKAWSDKPWMKRGDDYEAFKQKMADRLLENVYKYVPQTKGQIDYYEISTPLSTAHFCNYDQGEIYGLDHTPERFRQRWLRAHTPIKGLFLTGQDIVTDGVTGALFAGLVTASAILKKNIIGDVMRS